jgi:hypothetical protein
MKRLSLKVINSLRDNLSLGRVPIRSNLQATTCMGAIEVVLQHQAAMWARPSGLITWRFPSLALAAARSLPPATLLTPSFMTIVIEWRIKVVCGARWIGGLLFARQPAAPAEHVLIRANTAPELCAPSFLLGGRDWGPPPLSALHLRPFVRWLAHSLNTICTQSLLFVYFPSFHSSLPQNYRHAHRIYSQSTSSAKYKIKVLLWRTSRTVRMEYFSVQWNKQLIT